VKYPIDHWRRSQRDTLCQRLREAWRLCDEGGDPDAIKAEIEMAFDMAKRMNDRLQFYKQTYGNHGEDLQRP
jgi:hypothetical protein